MNTYYTNELTLTTEEQAELEASTYEELEARMSDLLNNDEVFNYEYL